MLHTFTSTHLQNLTPRSNHPPLLPSPPRPPRLEIKRMQQFKFKINCYQLVNEGDISPTSPDPIESIILKKEMVKWKYLFLLQFYICEKKKLEYTHGKMQPPDLSCHFYLSPNAVRPPLPLPIAIFKEANHTKNEQKHLAPTRVSA